MGHTRSVIGGTEFVRSWGDSAAPERVHAERLLPLANDPPFGFEGWTFRYEMELTFQTVQWQFRKPTAPK